MDRNWSGREHAEGCKGKKVDFTNLHHPRGSPHDQNSIPA